MTVADLFGLIATALMMLGSLFGTVYLAVRAGVRSAMRLELLVLELRVRETYVAQSTCHAIRDACTRLRAAEQHGCTHPQEVTP